MLRLPSIFSLLGFSLITSFFASSAYSAPMANLTQGIARLDKSATCLTDNARQYLAERDGDLVRVWIFFTDKGVFDQNEFGRTAAAVVLTDRARNRRAKVDLDRIVFADLPVIRDYVDEVIRLGGKHRRTSRWLNAASFEVPMVRLDDIAGLPFVAYARPVATFSKLRPLTDETDVREFRPESAAPAPDALNYGSSFGQLDQINVPAAHDRGLSGQGVTLAILDTGFRKTHAAFAQHIAHGRILAEYDFVWDDGDTADDPYNEADLGQWNHGTSVWSAAAAELDGTIYGPAYRANIILCKTEDERSETPIEEDNWVAALEFADSVGTDVISTSLGYSDWYTYSDYDGLTATITIAANTCDGLGIVMVNSMGNDGPGTGTLTPPADAFNILAVGSVSSTGVIANSSSRGPTYDGRTKPEVCAQGVNTFTAKSATDDSYGGSYGTSFAAPLVAGAACLVIEAYPTYTPAHVRESLKQTASIAPDSNNTYGWGIINVEAALDWCGADDDSDGTGNLCDTCTDIDGDGFGDPGYPENTCPDDNCPLVFNPDQADSDGDLLPDSCDNCPLDYNPEQLDGDHDLVADSCDNCPEVSNPGQEDANGDDLGDACCCLDITGNVDGDSQGIIDIGDLTALIAYLFIPPNPAPGCRLAGNVDGDPEGIVDIGDLTALIAYLFIPPNPLPNPCQ